MRALFIHADYLEYEVKKKTKVADAIPDESMKGRMEEVLVAYISFEKVDEGKEEASAKLLVENVVEIAEKVETKNIVLYPYAHLSSSLAKPDTGKAILKDAGLLLKEGGYEVLSSPFGWYKSFKISCKGHPLSELSREIVAGEDGGDGEEVSEALKSEEKAVSSFFIVQPDGDIHTLELKDNTVKGYDFGGYKRLKQFCQYEMAKSRAAGKEPPHVDMMQRLELVDYEPGSDPGNLRYYPKGRMIKSLLENYVTSKVKETGGMEIESPIMYDIEHPSLKSYLNRFPARQYSIQTPDKKVFLRFAACFGQFLMMHDATISYKQLPVRLYELSRYSFRAEQRGELTGLRRQRAFTMPDCHSFCADIHMAKTELLERFELSREIINGIGFELPDDLEMVVRTTKNFMDENKDFIVQMAGKWGKPVLVEMWEKRFFYFSFKYEWDFIDASGKSSALNTDQLDVENAERYDITYIGADGKEHLPLILHQSPSGGIERVMYAILENIHLKQLTGEKPKFPHWLAPTQARFLPVNPDFREDCVALASEMDARVDIDDRDEKIGRKIRDAEKDWIDFIIVYGDKEKESGKLS
ncbi:MAG: threonine--tRNA ligase, partial [Thermoplasmata archaeon]|nr:threonine--tRNA ligase [Thermoplasmata archaeon]